MSEQPAVVPHRFYEDVLALLLGCVLVSLGLAFYAKAALATGGVAGLSLLVQFSTGWNFGFVFFVLNLPFYALAVWRLGWAFALRTFVAVALVSALARLTPGWIAIDSLNPVYAAIAGGCLIGMGLLALFRHRAGLGGFNILAVFLQDDFGIRAGWFQLATDTLILLIALRTLPLDRVALSLAGAAVLNLILGINHRPGRYRGVS